MLPVVLLTLVLEVCSSVPGVLVVDESSQNSGIPEYNDDPAEQRFNVDDKREMVNMHNELRTKTVPSAANMQKMMWSEELSALAQKLVDDCKLAHGYVTDPNGKYRRVGQNLWATTGSTWSIRQLVTAWFDEYKYHTFNGPDGRYDNKCQPGKTCDHYTQVVWANSYEVGCALKYCAPGNMKGKTRNFLMVACNYGPPGNVNRQSMYFEGRGCTHCPAKRQKCVNGALCDWSVPCEGKRCSNGGTLHTDACICSCPAGFTGQFCLSAVSTVLRTQFKCDFSVDVCDMIQEVDGDQFNWKRSRGGTASRKTGPNKGTYILIEASKRKLYDLATISTPKIQAVAGTKMALGFRYHMQGRTMGSLQASVNYDNDASDIVLSVNGNQGNKWHQYCSTLVIPAQTTWFQVVFSGRVGSRDASDIAVDDIEVLPGGTCTEIDSSKATVTPPLVSTQPSKETTTIKPTQKPTTPTQKTTGPEAQFKCDFSADMCDMIQLLKVDHFNWRRRRGRTPSRNTGPSEGTYIHIEASNRRANEMATISTPKVRVSPGMKMVVRFRYHMYGRDMGGLVASVEYDNDDSNVLFANGGDRGNMWHQHCSTLVVPPQKTLIQVSFAGRVGSGGTSDIAVDDIEIYPGDSCHQSTLT